MNTYDIAIRLTDGSRKTMPDRAPPANAAEGGGRERCPGSYRGWKSIHSKKE